MPRVKQRTFHAGNQAAEKIEVLRQDECKKTIVTYGWSNVIDIVENCIKSLLEGRRRISNRHKQNSAGNRSNQSCTGVVKCNIQL